MECDPKLRLFVLTVAEPLARVCGLPIWVAPSKNVTVPVGVPTPVPEATVAVKITVWPKTEVGDDDVTVVLEVFWVCVNTTELGRYWILKILLPIVMVALLGRLRKV